MTGRRPGDGREAGSVVVEFIGLAVLLMVPLVYVLLALSQFQAAALASVTLADETARIQVRAPDAATAAARRALVVREIARDQGLDPGDVSVDLRCDRDCPGHGAVVTSTVRIRVPLPLMPAGAGRVGAVTTSSTQTTPRYG